MKAIGHLAFGQPIDGIIQIAYLVEDIDRAMPAYTELLGVGPWRADRCGRDDRPRLHWPSDGRVDPAAQNSPSIYMETISRVGYGFLHWGVGVEDIDADVARFASLGYEVVLSDELPTGGAVRYLDTTNDLPGMIELIGMNAAQERLYTSVHAASLAWDGKDPVRVLSIESPDTTVTIGHWVGGAIDLTPAVRYPWEARGTEPAVILAVPFDADESTGPHQDED